MPCNFCHCFHVQSAGREQLLNAAEAFYKMNLELLARSYDGLVAWFRLVSTKCLTEGQREVPNSTPSSWPVRELYIQGVVRCMNAQQVRQTWNLWSAWDRRVSYPSRACVTVMIGILSSMLQCVIPRIYLFMDLSFLCNCPVDCQGLQKHMSSLIRVLVCLSVARWLQLAGAFLLTP